MVRGIIALNGSILLLFPIVIIRFIPVLRRKVLSFEIFNQAVFRQRITEKFCFMCIITISCHRKQSFFFTSSSRNKCYGKISSFSRRQSNVGIHFNIKIIRVCTGNSNILNGNIHFSIFGVGNLKIFCFRSFINGKVTKIIVVGT